MKVEPQFILFVIISGKANLSIFCHLTIYCIQYIGWKTIDKSSCCVDIGKFVIFMNVIHVMQPSKS